MGLFGQSTSYDADVEKATSETNTNDNWSLILDVCDKVTTNPRGAKECLKSIMKRMGHTDPHVQMQAITLLDACSNNCGKPFHLEIASREFVNEYRRLLSKAQPKVSMKMRQVLKGWVEGDFKSDPELDLIPALYQTLRRERVEFNNLTDKPPKTSAKLTAAYKDPNVVSSQQEEDDIAKAIELSLKETKGGSPKHSTNNTNTSSSAYPSLYPTVSGSLGSIANATATESSQSSAPVEARKVRALYDFEAAEENELTFFAGEIIHVVDDSDPNWWKGYNQRGDGLFPSNFVTADLSVDPERLDINQQHKTKQTQDAEQLAKTEAAAAAAMAASNQPVEIDEPKVDRLLHLLHEANPEDPSQDTPEMLQLEQEVHQMGPLIDAELERVDRKHAQLTQLSSDLVDAINLYHSLMASDRAALAGSVGYGGAMPGLGGGYQAAANPQMLYGPGNGPGPAAGYFSPQHNSHQMPGGYAGAGQMNSLPFNPANASVAAMSSLPPNAGAAVAAAVPGMPNAYGQPVPMQFRNGDNWNAGNGYPPQQSTNGVPNGQHQPPTTQQQMPVYQNANLADPQQYASMPPQQQQRQFMSPQHQPQAPVPSQQPPLQYMPPTAGAPAGMPYASMPPNGPQSAYMPPQQQQQQQQQQLPPQTTAASNTLPTLHQAPPPPQTHPSTEQQYSQLQQQFNAMSMAMPPPQQQQQPGVGVGVGVGVGMPQTMANIPIYQQQR